MSIKLPEQHKSKINKIKSFFSNPFSKSKQKPLDLLRQNKQIQQLKEQEKLLTEQEQKEILDNYKQSHLYKKKRIYLTETHGLNPIKKINRNTGKKFNTKNQYNNAK